MLGLPASTEIHKVLTKKKVFEHFGANMSAERRKRFDADIARMTLVHEISPVSLNLEAGEAVQSLFVMHVLLRTADFDPQSIAYLSRMFGQKLVLLLEADNRQRLALWQTRLLMTPWAASGSLTLPLSGLNLDTVWENIVSHIAGIERAQGQTLDVPVPEAVALQIQQARGVLALVDEGQQGVVDPDGGHVLRLEHSPGEDLGVLPEVEAVVHQITGEAALLEASRAELLQKGGFEALLPDGQGVRNTLRDEAHRAPPFEAARRRAPRGSRSSSTMEIAHSGTVEDRL